MQVDEEHLAKNIAGIFDRIKCSKVQYEKEEQIHKESSRQYNALENSIVLLQSHINHLKNSKLPLIDKEKEMIDNLAGTYEELITTQCKRRFNEGEIVKARGHCMAIEKESKYNEELAKFYNDKIGLLMKETENYLFVDTHNSTVYKIPKIINSWIYVIGRDQQFLFLKREPNNESIRQISMSGNLRTSTLNQIDSQKTSLLKKLKGERGKNYHLSTSLNKIYERMLIQNIQLVSERNTLYETRQHYIAQEDNLLSKIVMMIEELINLFPRFKQKLSAYLRNIYSSLESNSLTKRSKSAIKGIRHSKNKSQLISINKY